MAQIVTIQGFEGSFHQVAARQYFGSEVGILPCATFREVVTAVQEGRVDAGLMAIENSIAGSILPNYGLLQRSGLYITGEVYLPIRQHLLVNPGVTLDDIREVHSHPIALQQCSEFLQQRHWKLVETEDTALSARRLHQHHHRHAAAVAGALAAELFGLEILVPDIHTEAQNYTRFLVLHREPAPAPAATKASICFGTRHERGSLARVLVQIAEAGINLSKLQSFPLPGTEWEYFFHADLEFDSTAPFEGLLDALKPLTTKLDVYGVYVNGRKR
ncbi:prephenate dehydratase [Flaviaesturariibacter amylovorans]|uniref:prephenate dehydratase n=1 Tax=Flaviaesturariibacter amylovorans TaxID=1084520 RepID=A0ABP8H2L3_9BACT